MLKKRIFVGIAISVIQILLFYMIYKSLWIFEPLFGLELQRTVFENLFLDWFFKDYAQVFAILILLQNTLIIITWRQKWTILLRVVTSFLHGLFWLENLETVFNESLILGIAGILFIWLGLFLENIFITLFGIKHPYRERDQYEDLNKVVKD